MKTLVTGGNGFLGAWLVRALTQAGHSVRVLHRKTSDMTSLRQVQFESCLGDVTDEASLLSATKGVEAVFHVAGMISYSPSDFAQMEKVNVTGTKNVVRACLKNKVGRLVHTSSVVAIGASKKPKFLNEDSPFELESFHFGYYETKRAAEKVITESVTKENLDAVIVNPSIMFGAGDAVKGSRRTHMKVAAGTFPFYASGGCNIMHVADAVEGHIKALEKGQKGERYILAGDNILVRDLFQMLAKAGGHAPPLIPLPNFLLRTAFNGARAAAKLGVKNVPQTDSAVIATLFHWYDTTKARRDLDLKCRPGFEAIKESVKWARENGYLKES